MATETATKTLAALQEYLVADMDKLLVRAKDNAKRGKTAIWSALAEAYSWFHQARNNPEYLERSYRVASIKSKDGVSEYNKLVKLVFGLDANKDSSTISRYVSVLVYLDSRVAEAQRKSALDRDGPEIDPGEPEQIVQLIQSAGGIDECIKAKRTADIKKNQPQRALAKKIEDKLIELSRSHYKSRQPIGKAQKDAMGQEGLVLLLGRLGAAFGTGEGAITGQRDIEIVDVIDASKSEIERYIKENALRDTTGVDPLINILGDTLAFSQGMKASPIVTVEQGGKKIIASMGPEQDASRVVTVIIDDVIPTLPSFPQRASLAADHRDWAIGNFVDPPRRHLFQLGLIPTPKAVAEVFVKNTATDQDTTLAFNAMTATTKGQLIVDPVQKNSWEVNFPVPLASLVHIYLDFLKPWSEEEKKTAKQKLIAMEFQGDEWRFSSDDTMSGTYKVTTGIPPQADACKATFFGADWVRIIGHIRQMIGVKDIRLCAHSSGLAELSFRAGIAIYTIAIPGARQDALGYVERHFTNLK